MEENKVLQPEVEEIFYMRKKMSLKTREEMKEEMLANDEIEKKEIKKYIDGKEYYKYRCTCHR